MTTKPWKVTGVIVRGQTAYLIEPAPESIEEVQAMRKLVEAAPDLLEALGDILRVMSCDDECTIPVAMIDAARAALAKAQPKATP